MIEKLLPTVFTAACLLIIVFVILELFTPRRLREWHIKRKYHATTIERVFRCDLSDLVNGNDDQNIYICTTTDGKTIRILESIKNAKSGLGRIRSYSKLD